MVTEGVVITGMFGVGKSSVVEEIAYVLERQGTTFAAIDLDWLRWFDRGDGAETSADPLFFANLAAVLGNYRGAGIDRYVMAGRAGGRRRAGRVDNNLGLLARDSPVDSASPCHCVPASGEPSQRPKGGSPRVAETWLDHGIGEELGQIVLPNDGRLRSNRRPNPEAGSGGAKHLASGRRQQLVHGPEQRGRLVMTTHRVSTVLPNRRRGEPSSRHPVLR